MGASPYFTDAARAQAATTVQAIESRTAAEVVIAVNARSGHYRHTDYLVGFGVSLAALVAMLYLPQEFPLETFPVGVALAFVAGVLVLQLLPGVRRRLTASALLDEAVRTTARAAFVDQGITRTTGRTGILVFVSLYERRVEVVTDLGVDPAALGEEWKRALAGVASAVAGSRDPAPFFQALLALTPPLERVLPRSPDDVNELPDAPLHVS
ncbi:hypothetical protein [Melittangium boletus]|uniref:hypothetical protein n=1 Tax=Melittangium boletus TaxID=83453 RepID=UPI003DA69F49